MFSNSEEQCNHGFFVSIRKKDGIGILDVEDSPKVGFALYQTTIKSNNVAPLVKKQRSSFKKADGTVIEYLITDDYKVGSHVLPKTNPQGYVAKGDVLDNTRGGLTVSSPVSGKTIQLKN